MSDKEENIETSNDFDEEITALDSFKEIMTAMNKHRLIVPSDFDDESFTPDL